MAEGLERGDTEKEKDREGCNIFVQNSWMNGAVTDGMGTTGRGAGFARKFKIPF